MFKSIRYVLPTLLSAFLAVTAANAQQVGIADANWQGNDFVIRFDDSLTGNIDYAASDSMQMVVNLSRPVVSDAKQFAGPNGLVAALTRNGKDSIAVLTVRGQSRIGYSFLWRPYSHRLIIHTFNWDSLAYAPEQYHKGLLALEQPEGLAEAKEYLSGANVFGDRRAASVLGVLYEREGEDSLAALYLSAPLDADDYMARAHLSSRAGDAEAATRNQEHFERKLGEQSDLSLPAGQPSRRSTDPPAQDETGKTSLSELFDDWRGIALVVLAALFIVVLAVWFSRRPSELSQKPLDETSPPPPPTHGITESESAATPATEPVAAPATEAEPATATEEPGQEISSPLTSSMQTPEIAPVAESIQEEPIAPVTKPDEVELPRPDAFPAKQEMTSAVEEPSETTEGSRRQSSQAEQLRQRMAHAQSGETQSTVAKNHETSPAGDDESTLNEARRLHVSRDYVELRNRISELKK